MWVLTLRAARWVALYGVRVSRIGALAAPLGTTMTVWSFTPVASVTLPSVGTNAHVVKVTFKTNYITVSYDGTPKISVADNNYDNVSPLTGGGIVTEFFNAGSNYTFGINDVSAVPFTSPQIQAVTLTNNSAVVSWQSIPGQSYLLQYKDDLVNGTWTTILPSVLATGASASATNGAIGPNQEYYRVMVVP